MAASAPRYDSRLLAAVPRLDDPSRPVAETVRRLGALADELGVTRPSYTHMRTYVAEHRGRAAAEEARRKAVRAVLVDAYWATAAGRYVDPIKLADRLREASR